MNTPVIIEKQVAESLIEKKVFRRKWSWSGSYRYSFVSVIRIGPLDHVTLNNIGFLPIEKLIGYKKETLKYINDINNSELVRQLKNIKPTGYSDSESA